MTMQTRRKPIVAIDGPVGSGKSTVARMLADRLGFLYLDTGAMYRAAAWKALQAGLHLEDQAAVGALVQQTNIELERSPGGLRVRCDGQDITDDIRRPNISRATSPVADNPLVRRRLVAIQQEIGRQGGIVIEGRDVGTVVFPDAEVKIFLDARPEERARRRTEELRAQGLEVSYDETLRDLLDRDRRDRSRPMGGLRVALGAIVIDSSDLSIEQVVEQAERIVRRLQLATGSVRIR